MPIETFPSPDLTWQQEALCAQTGGDFFFPEPGSSVREAKRICGLCPIRVACLDYAMAHDMRFGVWGGLSEKERLELRRAGRRPASRTAQGVGTTLVVEVREEARAAGSVSPAPADAPRERFLPEGRHVGAVAP